MGQLIDIPSSFSDAYIRCIKTWEMPLKSREIMHLDTIAGQKPLH